MTFVTNERERTGKEVANENEREKRYRTGAQGKVAVANSTHKLGLHPKS